MAQAKKDVSFVPGPHEDVQICEGMTFAMIEEFRSALQTYYVVNRFLIWKT